VRDAALEGQRGRSGRRAAGMGRHGLPGAKGDIGVDVREMPAGDLAGVAGLCERS
jgi:hypothetical protein